MKNDLLTKILLMSIAVFLGIIALKPIFQMETIQADNSDKFNHIQFDVEPGFLTFMDTKSGDIWVYVLDNNTQHIQFVGKLTKLGEPLSTETIEDSKHKEFEKQVQRKASAALLNYSEETQKKLTDDILQMLDDMNAHYKRNEVVINIQNKKIDIVIRYSLGQKEFTVVYQETRLE